MYALNETKRHVISKSNQNYYKNKTVEKILEDGI